MRHFFALTLILFAFTACNTDSSNNTDENQEEVAELIELKNKVAQLELENSQKDSVLNETFSFFNDIQINLLKITSKQDEIRLKSSDTELTNDDKEWILQEINNINFLRNQNAKTVASLRKQLKDSGIEITELKDMVDGLVKQIHDKDLQIASLQDQLADVNMEYANLFDEYQQQVELALDVMKEMNTVYYAYGTLEELIENGVLMKEGGFIGIGKKTNMAEDFNQKYFEKLDKTKVREIRIVGKKPKIATDHPLSSYDWNGDRLIIKDSDKFWRISSYLVITVK